MIAPALLLLCIAALIDRAYTLAVLLFLMAAFKAVTS